MPQPEPGTETQPKRGAPAAKERIWVGVRVPRTFHRRLQIECARRDLSLQELLVVALKWYFKTPYKEWTAARIAFQLDDPELSRKEAADQEAWSGLWDTYIDRMPTEKIEVLAAAMRWDLRTLKSSRRKPSAWKRRAQEQKG